MSSGPPNDSRWRGTELTALTSPVAREIFITAQTASHGPATTWRRGGGPACALGVVHPVATYWSAAGDRGRAPHSRGRYASLHVGAAVSISTESRIGFVALFTVEALATLTETRFLDATAHDSDTAQTQSCQNKSTHLMPLEPLLEPLFPLSLLQSGQHTGVPPSAGSSLRRRRRRLPCKRLDADWHPMAQEHAELFLRRLSAELFLLRLSVPPVLPLSLLAQAESLLVTGSTFCVYEPRMFGVLELSLSPAL